MYNKSLHLQLLHKRNFFYLIVDNNVHIFNMDEDIWTASQTRVTRIAETQKIQKIISDSNAVFIAINIF